MSQKYPDIASKAKSCLPSVLQRVGMSCIQTPVNLELGENNKVMQMAEADAYVNLIKPEAKGIHMSRLFITLQKALESKAFSLDLSKNILANFLESHNNLSDKAYLNVRYQHPLKQKSLTSDRNSWRSYPLSYSCTLNKENEFLVDLKFSVLYSSTCPCSAALSRQAQQEKFQDSYKEQIAKKEALEPSEIHDWLGKSESMTATPHSQRSKATVVLKLKNTTELKIEELIELVETSLKTPVQSIVKREDEKEFAKLNGQNLMFAEDAARRVKAALNSVSSLSSFNVEVCHYESLHAHNAVAYAEKDL